MDLTPYNEAVLKIFVLVQTMPTRDEESFSFNMKKSRDLERKASTS